MRGLWAEGELCSKLQGCRAVTAFDAHSALCPRIEVHGKRASASVVAAVASQLLRHQLHFSFDDYAPYSNHAVHLKAAQFIAQCKR